MPAICVQAAAYGAFLLSGLNAAEDCAAPRPCCVAPRAGAVHHAPVHAVLQPVASTGPSDVDDAPAAHCVRPVAKIVATPATCAAPALPSLGRLLLQWETASATRPTPSPRDREWLNRRCGGLLSAHAIDVVLQLSHAVTRCRLECDFDWEIVAQQERELILKATPRDEAVRLFCRELHVELSRDGGMPRNILVMARGDKADVVIASHQAPVAPIAHAAVDSLPPSPARAASLIRFAAFGAELEFELPR